MVVSKDKPIVHYEFSSLYPWALTEIHLSNAVVVHLGFQLDYVCNQQRHRWLDTLVSDFLDWIIWGERPHHTSGLHIFVTTHMKGHRRKEFLLSACPHSSWQVHVSCFCNIPLPRLQHFFACDRTYFSGFQQWQITSSSLGPGLQKQNGLLRYKLNYWLIQYQTVIRLCVCAYMYVHICTYYTIYMHRYTFIHI